MLEIAAFMLSASLIIGVLALIGSFWANWFWDDICEKTMLTCIVLFVVFGIVLSAARAVDKDEKVEAGTHEYILNKKTGEVSFEEVKKAEVSDGR